MAQLLKALCEDLNIPTERKYIVGHEDVDPISRGNRTKGWDPGKFDYGRLLSLVKAGEEPEDDAVCDVPTAIVVHGPRPVVVTPTPVSISSVVRDLFRMFWYR